MLTNNKATPLHARPFDANSIKYGSQLPVLYGDGAALSNKAILSLFIFSVLLFTFTLLLSLPHEIADEGFHAPQVYALMGGDYSAKKEITVLPVYHSIIAGLMNAMGISSLKLMRLLHLLVSACAIPVFYQLCKNLGQQNLDNRTLMFVLFPAILPLFSVIYTDIPALFFVLSMLILCLKKYYLISSIVGLLAIAMRQTNIIWVGFCCALVCIEYWRNVTPGLKIISLQNMRAMLLRLWPFAIVLFVVGLFFYENKGVAVGDITQHKIALNFSNIYFYLFIGFIFFLPYNIEKAPDIFKLIKNRPLIWFFVVAFFIFYMATFTVTHQYNSYGLSFFIRNVTLHYITEFPLHKALAFIPICWMALTFYELARQSSKPLDMVVLYVFSVLSVLPLPLIEQRYYIVSIVLFMAWKPASKKIVEQITLFFYIPFSIVLLYYISEFKFFL